MFPLQCLHRILKPAIDLLAGIILGIGRAIGETMAVVMVAIMILPSAMPGILSGIILATGRVVGETAALIYTSGTVAQIPQNLFGSGRTLAIHMYVLSSEGLHTNQAFATAVVLLIMVIGINALAGLLAKHIKK